MSQSSSAPTPGGYAVTPERVAARGGDLMVLRDQFSDVGRGVVDIADRLPVGAFGGLPESTVAASGHTDCTRSVQASILGTSAELDSLAEAMRATIAEYERVGERGAAQAAELRFEIEFCERFLPKGMDETALRALVAERVQALGIRDPKQAGRLIGDIMKTHKGQVDAGDVKRVAEEVLKAG